MTNWPHHEGIVGMGKGHESPIFRLRCKGGVNVIMVDHLEQCQWIELIFFSENLPLELPLRHLRWWQWCWCRICCVSRHSKSHCWSTGRCPANLVFAVKHLHIILDSTHFDLLCISFLIIIPPVVWIVHVGMGTNHSHRDRAALHSWLPRAPTCIKNLVSHLSYRHRHLTSPPWCHP